jgi:hypothetical protein
MFISGTRSRERIDKRIADCDRLERVIFSLSAVYHPTGSSRPEAATNQVQAAEGFILPDRPLWLTWRMSLTTIQNEKIHFLRPRNYCQGDRFDVLLVPLPSPIFGGSVIRSSIWELDLRAKAPACGLPHVDHRNRIALRV